MLYLKSFSFPDMELESLFLRNIKQTCYDTYYPFQVFRKNRLSKLEFEPITILYGGNGSGKTTVLNIIAEKLKLFRESLYNKSNFFEDYINICEYELENEPKEIKIVSSDEVFDFMLNLRSINEGIDLKREELFETYYKDRKSNFKLSSLDDYDELKRINLALNKSKSEYTRKNIVSNVREYSNGESAFMYFQNKIKDKGFYLLDEPENSLSPQKQLELVSFLEDSVRFFDCQFIIATHSPFLLSLKEAKIYDLDEPFIKIKKWTQLSNVRTYYNFFKKYEDEFEE